MRIRALAATAVASALLLGTAGCGVVVETATLKHYEPSDGVSANVGDLAIRNLLVITNDVGDASLVGTIVNDGSSLEFVTLEVRGTATLTAESGAYPGITTFGAATGNPVILNGVGVVAGEYVDVYVQYGGHEGQLVHVPVLDGVDPVYAGNVPNNG